jgi:hypothetical protein
VGEIFLEDQPTASTPWWMPSLSTESSSVVDYALTKDLNLIYYDPIPLDLLAEHGSIITMRGWYCTTCGKLNERFFFSHQRCTSRHCKVYLFAVSMFSFNLMFH